MKTLYVGLVQSKIDYCPVLPKLYEAINLLKETKKIGVKKVQLYLPEYGVVALCQHSFLIDREGLRLQLIYLLFLHPARI